MEVSLLNVRITFQKNEVVSDAIGNHRNQWTDYYSFYDMVSGESGSEKNVAANTLYDSDIAFTVRYCKVLKDADTTKLRVVFQGELYDITFIDNMNFKNKCLKIRCRKVRR
jgi:SPP1 family predicted phage head-tail adaptor